MPKGSTLFQVLQGLCNRLLPDLTEEAMVALLQRRLVRQNGDAEVLLQMDECAEASEKEELDELHKQ